MFHTVRVSAHSAETTFIVAERGVTVFADGAGRTNVPFAEVREVRLRTDAAGRCRCVIRTNRDRFVVTNRHFTPDGRYEDRSESYFGFLELLRQRLRPHAANVRFVECRRRQLGMVLVMFVLLPVLYAGGLLVFSSAATRPWTLLSALLVVPVSLMGTLLPLMCGRQKSAPPPASGNPAANRSESLR